MNLLALARSVLTHKYLALVFRVYIGGIFIYASLYKINYPAEFAETIANYQLVPYFLVNLMAIVLPWVELVCGLLLIVGFRVKAAALILVALLVVFGASILVNLLRDAPISCGCFHSLEAPMTWWTFIRDLIWLAMTLHIYLYDAVLQVEKRYAPNFNEAAP